MAPVAKKARPANAAGEGEGEAAGSGERVVMVSGEQHAREELARDMAEMMKHPLDRAKQPGGVYLVGGQHVDANGKPVKVKDEDDE